MTNTDSTRPNPQQVRRFIRLAIAFAVLYGVWATVLGFRIVVYQQAVRQHLWFALRARPRGIFPNDKTAQAVATQWVSEMNAVDPVNPCHPGPAFQLLGPAEGLRRMGPACTVTVGVRGHRIIVRGYDTQGYAMDNVFQRLHPPPRHL